MKKALVSQSGYTILEVLTALILFGFVFTALLKAVHTADSIRGRSARASRAAIIAENEADRIRNSALAGNEISDSSYEQTVHNTLFKVNRRIIGKDAFSIDTTGRSTQTIEIEVQPQPEGTPLLFRLIQGRAL